MLILEIVALDAALAACTASRGAYGTICGQPLGMKPQT
jgi:hypothetical protein